MGCLLELLFWESNHWYIPAPWESVPTTTKTDPTNREYLAPRTSPSFFLLLVSNFWGEFLASKFLSLTTARASSNLMHNPLETAAKASKQPTMIFRDAQFGSVTHPQNNVDDLLLEFVFVVVGFFFFVGFVFFFFWIFFGGTKSKKNASLGGRKTNNDSRTKFKIIVRCWVMSTTTVVVGVIYGWQVLKLAQLLLVKATTTTPEFLQ